MRARKQRMIFVAVLLAGVSVAAGLVFMALGGNMLYFFSPTQVKAGEAPQNQELRVGGMVVDGSVRHGDDLAVSFDLTDNASVITVSYKGTLPDLFREGQGIVATGKLTRPGHIQASQVLAKHDENYMPPEVAEALKMAKEGGALPASHPVKKY